MACPSSLSAASTVLRERASEEFNHLAEGFVRRDRVVARPLVAHECGLRRIEFHTKAHARRAQSFDDLLAPLRGTVRVCRAEYEKHLAANLARASERARVRVFAQ